MSFGLARGRELSDEGVGLTSAELPLLPDAVMTDREAGRLDPRCWFSNPGAPLEIEIGSGKGTFLVEQSARSPAVNYLGMEWEREFYLYTADRLRRRGVANVRMAHVNAVDFLKWRVPDGIVSVIHLYYSDPWPKAKHHKNRVVQHAFLADAWRVLIPTGELRVVTDHDELWQWNLEHFADWCAPEESGYRRLSPPPGPELERVRSVCNPPFRQGDFVPLDWVGDGGAVGTNYEKKMTGSGLIKLPLACVLVKRSPTA